MAQDLAALGTLIRASREARGLSVEQVAARVCEQHIARSADDDVYDPDCVARELRRVESGQLPASSAHEFLASDLEEYARAIAIADTENDRWYAAFGAAPTALHEAIDAHPECWKAVRRIIAQTAESAAHMTRSDVVRGVLMSGVEAASASG